MNRKISVIFLLMAALALVISGLGSCLSGKGIDNAHNSKNSLDWAGMYTGTTPAASGSGIDVRLKLNKDQTYVMSYKYLDRSNTPVDWSGSFKWDDTGSIIILDKTDAPFQYKVAENKLIQLDMSGKQIKGKLADNYVLTKER